MAFLPLERVRYLSTRIKGALASGTLMERSARYLETKVRVPLEVVAGYPRLPAEDRKLDVRGGCADHRESSRHVRSNEDHVQRIMRAYRAAKAAQVHEPEPLRIRGLWAEWIATSFGPLTDAIQAGDGVRLSALLENFHRERFSGGMGGYEEYVRSRGTLGEQYIKYVWSSYRDKLLDLDFDLAGLSYPWVGNPSGVLFNASVISINTVRHAYRAVEMSHVLRDIEDPVIAEIGSGLGGQAYQTLLLTPNGRYVLFDIPEICILSSYLLLSAFPEKRVRLFGEATQDGIADGDIAVLPHFAVPDLPEDSIDLFYNSCSLSEMDARAATAYLGIIEKASRRFFMHDNHDFPFQLTSPDGTTSVNIAGSKLVPDGRRFKRLYKKPRVHGLPEDRGIVHFEYLYQRLAR